MAPRAKPTDQFMNRLPRPGVLPDCSVPRGLRLPTPDEAKRGMYRAVIDRLQPNERFRVETQFGAYEMSAAQFASTFPNIVASASYREGSPRQHGKCVYVVGPPPDAARRFKV